MEPLTRIEVNPEIMAGQAVVAGTRLPVYVIVEAIAEGDTVEQLLEAYPFLSREDIREALRFAARMSHSTLEVA